jgi:hypothetical protein
VTGQEGDAPPFVHDLPPYGGLVLQMRTWYFLLYKIITISTQSGLYHPNFVTISFVALAMPVVFQIRQVVFTGLKTNRFIMTLERFSYLMLLSNFSELIAVLYVEQEDGSRSR